MCNKFTGAPLKMRKAFNNQANLYHNPRLFHKNYESTSF